MFEQGRYRDAAELLVRDRRFEDAGNCFLWELPQQLTPVARLTDAMRRSALHAAVCYERCGLTDRAVSLFANLGEFDRAAELLKKSGRREDAALARRGLPVPGALWPPGMLAAQLPDASGSQEGVSAHELIDQADRVWRNGRHDEAVDLLVKVEAGQGAYADAVGRVARIAFHEGVWSAQLETWFDPWLLDIAQAELGEDDVDTLYAIARLFETEGLTVKAEVTYRAIVDAVGAFADVEPRLAALRTQAPRRRPSLPGLPALPDLPSLPAAPSPAADEDSAEWLSGRPSDDGLYVAGPDGPADPPALSELAPLAQPAAPTASAPWSVSAASSAPVDSSVPAASSAPVAEAPSKAPWESQTAEQQDQLTEELMRRSQEMGLGVIGPGTVVNDRYRIEGPVGEGGYAVVYRATDLAIDEPVAVKLFNQDARDAVAVGRFKQEMRLARRLAHPAVVKTWEFGVWRNAYFITMELLIGTELHQHVRACGGSMPLPPTIELAKQAFDGLQHAHDAGIVHRDIKPQNLFVVDEGRRLKIMDFGIAESQAAAASLTRTGRVVGTPCFIAPERLHRGLRSLTPASDQYAMGVVLYLMLTGTLPFDERDVGALFKRVLRERPRPPSAHVSDIPGVMDDLILRLLEKDPDDRFESCREVQETLDRIGRDARRYAAWDE